MSSLASYIVSELGFKREKKQLQQKVYCFTISIVILKSVVLRVHHNALVVDIHELDNWLQQRAIHCKSTIDSKSRLSIRFVVHAKLHAWCV